MQCKTIFPFNGMQAAWLADSKMRPLSKVRSVIHIIG